MTYIELINAVWELREQGVITMHEHDLYNYLLHKCNRLNWKNPFCQSTSIMCAVLGVNRNALLDRRRRLKQLGLITYKEGKARTKPAEYRILNIENKVYPFNKNQYSVPSKTKKPKVRKEPFCPPQLEEVVQYCAERNNEVDAQAFIDFYQSKNWMIGFNRMKDWRAAVRSWKKKSSHEIHNAILKDNDREYEKF